MLTLIRTFLMIIFLQLSLSPALASESFSTGFTDEQGHPIDPSQWEGDMQVLAFFYTSCQVTCPLVVKQVREIEKKMTATKRTGRILLITIDPEHDTPVRLKQFRQKRGITSTQWHFLRGDAAYTERYAASLGFHYSRDEDHLIHHGSNFVWTRGQKVPRVLEGWNADLDVLFND